MTELHPSDVIENTADYIEEHGWTQRHMIDSEGKVCILGGFCLGVTNIFTSNTTEAVHAAKYAVAIAVWDAWRPGARCHATTSGVISSWNDAEGRTEQEVLDILRKTAKEQRILEEDVQQIWRRAMLPTSEPTETAEADKQEESNQ